MLLHKLAYGPL